jgi:hypothetical protein
MKNVVKHWVRRVKHRIVCSNLGIELAGCVCGCCSWYLLASVAYASWRESHCPFAVMRAKRSWGAYLLQAIGACQSSSAHVVVEWGALGFHNLQPERAGWRWVKVRSNSVEVKGFGKLPELRTHLLNKAAADYVLYICWSGNPVVLTA